MILLTVLPIIGNIGLKGGFLIVLFLCYLVVMGFEFVNGFMIPLINQVIKRFYMYKPLDKFGEQKLKFCR